MKKYLLILIYVISISSFAVTKISKECVGDVTQFAPLKEYIAVKIIVKESLFNLNEIKVSTTFDNYQTCKDHLSEELIIPIEGNISYQLSDPTLKCYATNISKNIYYLVNEFRDKNSDTVLALDKLQEFDNLFNCVENL